MGSEMCIRDSDTDQARLTRLFFQPVLVAWALWSTEAWKTWRQGRKNS